MFDRHIREVIQPARQFKIREQEGKITEKQVLEGIRKKQKLVRKMKNNNLKMSIRRDKINLTENKAAHEYFGWGDQI